MLLTSVNSRTSVVSIPVDSLNADELLEREWLLTNKRGGYSSGTISGCNTRRYHGLLVGALNPPAGRMVGLSTCLESVIIDGRANDLCGFEFDGGNPAGRPAGLTEFRRDGGVHFEYSIEGVTLTKSIYLVPDEDKVAISYYFSSVPSPIFFTVRPFAAMRDFHSLQKSTADIQSSWVADGVAVRHNFPGSAELFLRADGMWFEQDGQWWYKFSYRKEKERGQDFSEDIRTPGVFKCRIESPTEVVLWASLSASPAWQEKPLNIDDVRESLEAREAELLKGPKIKDERQRALTLAADQFIAKRQAKKKKRTTILAGYPWFMDWGRDAMISLPGLLLATHRYEEALSVLMLYAENVSEGMAPNCFDDYESKAHYNSIDASLWFINAAFEYLAASGNEAAMREHLLPAIRWIIDSYYNGTRFGIHTDVDGLIGGGDENTQLTWMDAKCDGVVFTPRYGKTVEVNALWYNIMCRLAEFHRDKDADTAEHYGYMAEEIAESFCGLFWNEERGYLNDCILPDGTADTSIRPNQIFAVSLPFSPLSEQQQRSVVEVVYRHLLTPYGLRTLSPSDSRYIGRYCGDQKSRDAAYHQGTVWPYLIGPFAEAYLKVNRFSKESKRDAAGFIEPLMRHLIQDGCIGSVSEIFDGDTPHRPHGCFAQAWSVAELLRAYMLVYG